MDRDFVIALAVMVTLAGLGGAGLSVLLRVVLV